MNVIFLDIDGVLNNYKTTTLSPMGFTGISSNLLKRFSMLVKETDSYIVLSSTWKDEWSQDMNKSSEDGKYLHKKLLQTGIYIIDKINDEEIGLSHRGAAIAFYLGTHPEITNYVILDDCEFDFYDYPDLLKHFVKVDEKIGISNEDIEKSLKIFNKKYKVESFLERE